MRVGSEMSRKKFILKELRETIEDIVSLHGLVETEEALNIVILGIRHTGIENIKAED